MAAIATGTLGLVAALERGHLLSPPDVDASLASAASQGQIVDEMVNRIPCTEEEVLAFQATAKALSQQAATIAADFIEDCALLPDCQATLPAGFQVQVDIPTALDALPSLPIMCSRHNVTETIRVDGRETSLFQRAKFEREEGTLRTYPFLWLKGDPCRQPSVLAHEAMHQTFDHPVTESGDLLTPRDWLYTLQYSVRKSCTNSPSFRIQ